MIVNQDPLQLNKMILKGILVCRTTNRLKHLFPFISRIPTSKHFEAALNSSIIFKFKMLKINNKDIDAQ